MTIKKYMVKYNAPQFNLEVLEDKIAQPLFGFRGSMHDFWINDHEAMEVLDRSRLLYEKAINYGYDEHELTHMTSLELFEELTGKSIDDELYYFLESKGALEDLCNNFNEYCKDLNEDIFKLINKLAFKITDIEDEGDYKEIYFELDDNEEFDLRNQINKIYDEYIETFRNFKLYHYNEEVSEEPLFILGFVDILPKIILHDNL